MKFYHVEILSPVEIIAEHTPGKTAHDAIERVLNSAGFTGFRYCWTQGAPVDYPAGKHPAFPVFTKDREFIHTVAWTE